MTTTRSAASSASSRWCVANRTVRPEAEYERIFFQKALRE
jgi:hypothetical protein